MVHNNYEWELKLGHKDYFYYSFIKGLYWRLYLMKDV